MRAIPKSGRMYSGGEASKIFGWGQKAWDGTRRVREVLAHSSRGGPGAALPKRHEIGM